MALLAYGSKVLSPAETMWSTTEKEFYAIVYFVKKFRHFLSGSFLIFTDHNALRYISTMRDSSHKICRWLNFLLQFRFEIYHRPGDSRDMLVPDILSRMISELPDDGEELALRMERPLLRSHQGSLSPALMSWFCVEPATVEDFDDQNNLKEMEGNEGPRKRNTHLPIILKRLQKVTETENGVEK